MRIAPEMYSISEMGLVKEIYGIRTAFEKVNRSDPAYGTGERFNF